MNIGLIGCGKMGSALLGGWIKDKTAPQITVIEPGALPEEFMNVPTIEHFKEPGALPEGLDALVLAVKPQIMKDVLAALPQNKLSETLVLSIAAGMPLSFFQTALGAGHAIIRAMPNTPALIGKGITVAIANGSVSSHQKACAEKLLSAAGMLLWIEDEDFMDAVTALSGSGPAYVFLLIETLAKAGEKAGLPTNIAEKLARQTVIGSAALAESRPDTNAATLRENVTSPGGTTQAALDILMNGKLQNLFDEALAAAKRRSKELGN